MMLTAVCALSLVLFDLARARENCLDALIALFNCSNWVKAFSLSHNGLGMVAQTWSLSAEEQFYLFWPILLVSLARLTKKSCYHHRRYDVHCPAVVG